MNIKGSIDSFKSLARWRIYFVALCWTSCMSWARLWSLRPKTGPPLINLIKIEYKALSTCHELLDSYWNGIQHMKRGGEKLRNCVLPTLKVESYVHIPHRHKACILIMMVLKDAYSCFVIFFNFTYSSNLMLYFSAKNSAKWLCSIFMPTSNYTQ